MGEGGRDQGQERSKDRREEHGQEREVGREKRGAGEGSWQKLRMEKKRDRVTG